MRARIPELPDRGELDKFVVGVAATGDACSLNRLQHGPRRGCMEAAEGEGALEELDDLHTIYVENRLAPFFADVNKVLVELPADVLSGSAAFRKFVANGVSSSHIARHPETFCGPGPVLLDRAIVAVSAARQHRMYCSSAIATPTSGQPRPTNSKREESSAREGGRLTLGATLASKARPGAATTSSDFGATMQRSASAPTSIAATLLLADAVPKQSLTAGGPGDSKHSLEATSTEEARHMTPDHLGTISHYGFFARSLLRGEQFGCDSTRDFWKRMVVKEGRELSRRTLCQASETEEDPSRAKIAGRLPALPPPGPLDVFRVPRHGNDRPMDVRHKSSVRMREALSSSKADPQPQARMWTEVIARDICEGLRVVVLGEQPSQVPRSMRRNEPLNERSAASREEAVKVYKTYRVLADMGFRGEVDESSSCEDGESHRDTSSGGNNESGPQQPCSSAETRWSPKGLLPIAWSALLMWAQHKEDFASDFRHRSVCAALNRGLKDWRQAQTSRLQRRLGVRLSQLFQWIWPEVSDSHIATMLTWVCLLEVDRIRQPTPRLIEAQEAKRLEKIFRLLGGDGGRDYVTPEEIAGGQDQGVDAKLKNIVDRETVVAVCGEGEIRRAEFLELMCEDGFRAHELAQQAVLRDGRRVVRQHRDALGVDIWVLEEAPREECEQRLLVDALEAEVRRWRRRVEQRAAVAAPLPQRGRSFPAADASAVSTSLLLPTGGLGGGGSELDHQPCS